MGLIKANTISSRAVAFSLRDVEAHAQGIIAKAQADAARLLEVAQIEGDTIRGERFERGYDEGVEAGRAKGLEEGWKAGHDEALAAHSDKLEALIGALAGAATQLETSRRKLEQETVYDVVRLAVAIARRVTKRLGDIAPEVVTANVAEALRMVVNASAVKVALNPSQLEVLEQELPKIRAMFPKLEQVELVGDPSLSPGGCRLLVGSGIVDADLDTQLDRVVADLLPPDVGAPA
jgi:flagellar assembly protein FliH